MIERITNDTLRALEYVTIENIPKEDPVNWWLWISIAEFILILLLFLLLQCKRKKQTEEADDERRRFKKESLKGDIDFDNIINSSFHATELYDRLKVKCHPDRFPLDDARNKVAENLFQEIEKNKNNINRLKELQQEASDKLGINL